MKKKTTEMFQRVILFKGIKIFLRTCLFWGSILVLMFFLYVSQWYNQYCLGAMDLFGAAKLLTKSKLKLVVFTLQWSTFSSGWTSSVINQSSPTVSDLLTYPNVCKHEVTILLDTVKWLDYLIFCLKVISIALKSRDNKSG